MIKNNLFKNMKFYSKNLTQIVCGKCLILGLLE